MSEQQTGTAGAPPPPAVRRVAAIDVGSNSVKLLVADVCGLRLEEIDSRSVVTRVARGAAARGSIEPRALAATREVLADCVEQATRLGATRVVAAATGGLRLAPDPAAVAAELGRGLIELPVLEPEVEACLSLLGVRCGAGWPAELLSIDLGGASTEITRLRPGKLEATSLDAGAITLTERFLAADPPAPEELSRLDRWLRALLAREALPVEPPPDGPLLAVGGAISALACAILEVPAGRAGQTHGAILERDRIETLTRWLDASSGRRRQVELGIEAGRADILVAGAHLALAVVDHYRCGAIQVSAWGVRHGLGLTAGNAIDARADRDLALRLAMDSPDAPGHPMASPDRGNRPNL